MIIMICLGIVLLEIAVLMRSNKKNKEMYNYIRAAANIARNMQLEQMLRNPYDSSTQNEPAHDMIHFICLTQMNSQVKHEYVYSLNEVIRIGRAKSGNQLIVNDGYVSEFHCVIYTDNGAVFIRDNNSANGVVVRTGFSKKILVNNGGSLQLQDSNILNLGSTMFKVRFITLPEM